MVTFPETMDIKLESPKKEIVHRHEEDTREGTKKLVFQDSPSRSKDADMVPELILISLNKR